MPSVLEKEKRKEACFVVSGKFARNVIASTSLLSRDVAGGFGGRRGRTPPGQRAVSTLLLLQERIFLSTRALFVLECMVVCMYVAVDWLVGLVRGVSR